MVKVERVKLNARVILNKQYNGIKELKNDKLANKVILKELEYVKIL